MTYKPGAPMFPKDVLEMHEQGRFSPTIREAWKKRYGDPVEDAKECLADQRKRITLGGIVLFVVIILFILAKWFDAVSVSTTYVVIAGGIGFLLFFVAIPLFLWNDDENQAFAHNDDEFGWNLREIMTLAKAGPILMTRLTEHELRDRVTHALVEQAGIVLHAEWKNANKPNAENENAYDKARAYFGQQFNIARRFGLADNQGWTPYFDEARRRLATND